MQCESRDVSGECRMNNFSGITSLPGVSDPDKVTISSSSDFDHTCYKTLTTVSQSWSSFSFSWNGLFQYTITLVKENDQFCKPPFNMDFFFLSFRSCMASPTCVIYKSLCSQRSWEQKFWEFARSCAQWQGRGKGREKVGQLNSSTHIEASCPDALSHGNWLQGTMKLCALKGWRTSKVFSKQKQ